MEKAPTKIWISNIDSKLGFHLVQKLRNDYVDLDNFNLFVGTKQHALQSQSYQEQLNNRHVHSQIHKLLNYKNQKHRPLIAKCVSQCDIVIIDLRNASQETQFVINCIQWMTKRQQHAQQQASKKVKVLGIGSHMTWAYDKSNNCKLDNIDKEQTISKILAYDPQKQQKILDSNRNRYIPHHQWTRQFQLQKRLLSLNKHSNISTCIITAGLMYGRDFPSQQIQDLVSRCYDVAAQVHVYGQGNNIIPTVHVDDFCNHVQWVLNNMDEGKIKGQHVISVDQNIVSQAKIVQTLLQNSGYKKQIQTVPLYHLCREQCLMSQSVPLTKSSIFQQIPSTFSSICQYFSSQYNQLSQIALLPLHLVLYKMQHQQQPQLVDKIVSQLQTVVQVIKQSDIIDSICEKQNIQHDQVDIHQISAQIQGKYLHKYHKQSYVLVLTQTLLDVSVVQKYNLKKFQIQQHAQMILSHKYKEYTAEYKAHKQEQATRNSRTTSILQPQPQSYTPPIAQSSEDKQPAQIPQSNQKQVQQYRKIDQYLLDNVIGYIAQACFKMRKTKNPNLKCFINQLKTIYDRQSNAAIIQMQKENKYLSVQINNTNC